MEKRSIKNRKTIYVALGLLAVFLIFYVLFNPGVIFGGGVGDRTICPYKVEGDLESDFVIKYIDSPYCVWCWFQEPILKKAIKTKGELFRLERYDIRYCDGIVDKYRIAGTPSFVFSIDGGVTEYSHMGYIEKELFFAIICDATRGC